MPALTACIFSGNSAGSGGAMYNRNSAPAVTNCTFSANTSTLGGGAMYNYSSSPVVTNCTFSGNSAYAGGAMCNQSSSPAVTNSIFWGDGPDEIYSVGRVLEWTGEISWGDDPGEIAGAESSPSVTYSDVQGGYPGTGNIDANPLFVNSSSGDYHLGAGSPCIDAGTNDAPNLPPYDFEGDPRIWDGDGDGNAVVDMGVDEYVPSLHLNALKLAWRAGTQPGTYRVAAGVRVHDRDHALAPGVTVFGDWTLPNGTIEHKTALTNDRGQAKLSLKGNQAGTYSFCASDMTKNGYVYDPAANETPACKAIVVGP